MAILAWQPSPARDQLSSMPGEVRVFRSTFLRDRVTALRLNVLRHWFPLSRYALYSARQA
ncbi:hypothetical protein [Streptomyces sp. NPDC004284]|uniref:hypothetical protein n=1 Tax=Streptomyces sp. NPDC004284 TaxID=3364695 RepID=UPI00368D9EF8